MSAIMLDTCGLIWLVNEGGKISEETLFSASLPFIHKDPTDRIIIATAILNRLPVVTHDSRFSQYSIDVLR